MDTNFLFNRFTQFLKFRPNQEISLKNLIEKFLSKLQDEIEFEAGSLFLIDPETQCLKEVAKIGEGIDFINTVKFPMGCGLSAWVAQKGKLIYLPDIHRGSRHGESPVRCYISIPLEINNKIVGVLNLGHIKPHAFDEKIDIIKSLCKEFLFKIFNRSTELISLTLF